jgi:Tfp pilus assembly protein PilX
MMLTRSSAAAHDERGIALILSLFLMLAMSVVGASLMYLSQSESYSSMNYRLMSQARYGAEAGIQRAANFLMYSSSYTPPSTDSATDPIGSFVTTVSPVTYNGNPVILSANANVTSNYPAAAVKTAFAAIAGSLSTGTANVSYAPYATLLSMEEIPAADTVDGAAHTIQTWQITADGTIPVGGRTAQVQVVATLDTDKFSTSSPALSYGLFAVSPDCGALTFAGGSQSKSYDSSVYTENGSAPTAANGGVANHTGNVGTNGNLTESGSATVIYGSLSTPRVGVGNCSSGNVDAYSSSGHATLVDGLVQLPQPITLPTPNIVNPNPPTSNIQITGSKTCADIPLPAGATCSGTDASSGLTVNPNGQTIAWGNLSLSSGAKITIGGGTYNINDVSLAGGSTFTTSSGEVTMTIVKGFSLAGNSTIEIGTTTHLNVVDTPSAGSQIDFSGGTVSNTSYSSMRFQIQYGGTGTVKLSGGSANAAVVYAPNAAVQFVGGSGFYGEVVGKTITDQGGTTIYYDRHLKETGIFSSTKWMPGNPMLSSFSWKTF